MNLSTFPNLSRAYEIAINGCFTLSIIADLEEYPGFIEDKPAIEDFYSHVFFTDNADIIVEISKPRTDNDKGSGTMDTLMQRCGRFQPSLETLSLNSGCEGLLKTAYDRLQISPLKKDHIVKIAAVIATMDRSIHIQVAHIAEAIQCVYTKDRTKQEQTQKIISELSTMSLEGLNMVYSFINDRKMIGKL